MSAVTPAPADSETGGFGGIRLWHRDLGSYPTGRYRIFLLAIVVLANIVFTWTVAAGSAATTVMFVHYNMTLNYYADLLVIAGVCGGVAAYVTSFGDKWGRANMVVIGLAINAVFALWAVPEAGNKTLYSVATRFSLLLPLAFSSSNQRTTGKTCSAPAWWSPGSIWYLSRRAPWVHE